MCKIVRVKWTIPALLGVILERVFECLMFGGAERNDSDDQNPN